MKAALWYKSGDIRIEDIPEPSPCAGEVKIKVKWCGICGSDLHEFTMGPIFIPVENPHPITQEVAPVIMGHEFSRRDNGGRRGSDESGCRRPRDG